MRRANELFSDMPNEGLPSVSPYNPDIRGPRVLTDARDNIDQCSLYIGTRIFGRNHPKRFALRVMNDILGAGMSSRLFREVRERRGLAYSVGSGYGYLADAGSFTISAGVNREKLAETIKVCLDEAEQMATQAIPPEEIRKAKDHTIGRFRLSLETAYSLGQRHGELILTRGEIETVEEFVNGIEAVTEDDVRGIAEEIIKRDRFHCSVVGPRLDEDEIANALDA